MVERTCGVDGCGKAHRAKGLCVTHYNQQMPNRYRKVTVVCANCGAPCQKHTGTKYELRFCSMSCRDAKRKADGDSRVRSWQGFTAKRDLATLRELRRRHLDVLRAATACVVQGRRTPAELQAIADAMRPRPCDDCGTQYQPGTTVQRYCGPRCAKRVGRRARRAAEHGAAGSFTWTELMRLFLKFDRRCAYCDERVGGQPDPEHVVPLSRGGSNSITNLLPACRGCNTDKRDLSLAEWAASREARGLPPVRTSWADDDQRFWHLTVSRPGFEAA